MEGKVPDAGKTARLPEVIFELQLIDRPAIDG
jgi:hypothetical protein